MTYGIQSSADFRCGSATLDYLHHLIEKTHGTNFEVARWVLFSDDSAGMSRLNAEWKDCVELVIVLIQDLSRLDSDLVQTILLSENINIQKTVLITNEKNSRFNFDKNFSFSLSIDALGLGGVLKFLSH